MRELGNIKQKTFIKANLNKKLEGLVQLETDPETGWQKAVTSNYLIVFLKKQPGMGGKIIDLVPEQCDHHMNLIGKMIPTL